jgi:hypothetical protein
MNVWENMTSSLSFNPQNELSYTPIADNSFFSWEFSFVPFIDDVESRLLAYADAFPGGPLDPDFERASIESWRAAENIE